MDLYRVLRVSLYFLAATGAFAISVSEQSLLYLLVVIAGSLAAYYRMDARREKPPRFHFLGAFALILLLGNFMPLREGEHWDRQCLSAMAHFLCGIQVLLFFVPYHDLVLLCNGLFTLAIVIITGILLPDATIVLRLAFFLVLVAWTLFIHSLFRARRRFSSNSRVSGRRRHIENSAAIEPEILPERALWQGVFMTVVLSTACLMMGFVLFFSAPRPERLMSLFNSFGERNENRHLTSGGGSFGRSGSGEMNSGWQEQMSLNSLGPIRENQGQALTLNIADFKREYADEVGRIFLRGMAYSRYVGGEWSAPGERTPMGGDDAKFVSIADPSLAGVDLIGAEIRETIAVNIQSHIFFSIGPTTRINVSKAEIDSEGAVHAPGDQALEKYEVTGRAPIYAQQLPSQAVAAHPEVQRYVRDVGMGPDAEEEIRGLSLRITQNGNTSLEKIQRIIEWLRENCSYTMHLDQLNRQNDPVRDFLKSEDAKQRRGHCGYFASSFVLLCRLSGIPARLATGFSVRLSNGDTSGKFVVKNSDAHAWGEVFFKDIGWVPFDPTPPAPAEEKEPAVAQATPATPPIVQPGENETKDIWKKNVLEYGSHEQREIYDKIGRMLKISVGDVGSIFGGDGLGGWFGAAIAWLGAGVLIFWGTQAFLRRGERRALRGASAGQRARAAVSFYNDLLQVLSRRGFVRKPGQTPREFAEYVVRNGGQSFSSVLTVTEVFENVRYGGADISQEEFNALQNAMDNLREITFAAAATQKA